MASTDDPGGQSERGAERPRDDGHLRGQFRRDPFVVLLKTMGRGPELLNALQDRFSRLPGWIRLSTGVGTTVVSIYFGRTVRTATDGLIALVEPVVGRFVGVSVGTWILIVLLLGVSSQVAVVNSRLERLIRIVGRKSKASVVDIVGNMEEDAVTDGGRGHVHDGSDHVTGSWKGILAGIVAGAALGSLFGVDGVTGGAVFGAFVGDEVERYLIRRRS